MPRPETRLAAAPAPPAPESPRPPDDPAPAPRERPARALLAVLAVLALFLAPALSPEAELVYRDTGRMHAPTKEWIGAELRSGRFPAWNPYEGLGTPVLGNGTSALLHPFTLLHVVLPPGIAVKAWVALSLALAAGGAFAWARRRGGTPATAAVGALAFALSGPLVSSSDNLTYLATYAAAPWVFAAVEAFLASGGPGPLALVALASALCAAGGDPQGWAIAAAGAPALAAATGDGPRARRLGRALAAFGVAVVAAAPVLAPLASWVPHSYRAAGLPPEELERWNLHPRRLAELVVPELFRGDPGDPLAPAFRAYAGNRVTPLPWFVSVYLGAAACALAAYAAVRDRRARLLVAAAAVFAWAALGPNGGFGQLAARLPVLSGFRFWEKLAVWIALAVALAAARGGRLLARDDGASRGLRRAALAAAAILGAAAATAALAPGVVAGAAGGPPEAAAALAANLARGALHAALVLAALGTLAAGPVRRRLEGHVGLALAVLVGVDLFGGSGGAYVLGPAQRRDPPPLAAALDRADDRRVLTPYDGREDRWPELGRVGSTAEWQRRTLVASYNVALRVGNPQDYVPLRDARWMRLRTEVPDDRGVLRLGLFGFAYVVVPQAPALAAKIGLQPPYQVVASDPELPAHLLAIPHRPRAYVAEEAVAADPAAALAWAERGGAPGQAVIEAPLAEPVRGRGEAHVTVDHPTEVVVEARTDGRALLVLNDAFAPGWTATVDGAPADLLRANGVVRGVFVGPGAHRVAFRYVTPGLAAGWAIAAALAAGLGAWGAARRRRGAVPLATP